MLTPEEAGEGTTGRRPVGGNVTLRVAKKL